MQTRELTKIALGTALIAVGAFIKIPSPVAGYFTLQLPMIILISVALGVSLASKSALLYMFGGLVGIPWFASGGGLMYLLKPSFGFIVAFIIATFIAGQGYKYNKLYKVTFFSILATLFVWLSGMLYYVTISKFYLELDISYALVAGIFISPDFYADIIFTVVFASIAMRIRRVI